MPAKNALRDVNPLALTLCKQGANRQRIFLRKTAVAEKDMLTLAPSMAILKSADEDWSVFYCVVAVPDAEEDPGLTGDADSVDVWEAGEIRKAAHRLLKNGAFINTVHDGPAAEGCAIVESAVALADFTVADTTIPEGAWYVAIEPTAELRKSIDDGDVEAISLEGSGVRVPLEKAASFGEVIGAKQLRDALWSATSTLEDVIYTALRDEDEPDPKSVILRSLDEFVNYLAPMLDSVTGDGRAALAKQLSTLRASSSTQEEPMGLAEDFAAFKQETETKLGEISDVKKSTDATTAAVTGLVDLTGKLVERVEALSAGTAAAAKKGDDEGEPTSVKKAVDALGEVADSVDALDKKLTGLAKSVAQLAEGDSGQPGDDDTIRKSKTNGSHPLAGLLD